MTFSFTSMIRLLVALGISSTLLAIGVARLVPPQPTRRSFRAVTSYNINEFFLPFGHRQSRWIDSETGAMSVSPIPDDDILQAASASPWVDESGRRQVIGLWSSRTYRGTNTLCDNVGLARYSFPDGRLLDHVPADVVPVGPPCWIPGTRAQVVFAAGDGQLYRFAFEPDGPLAAPDAPRDPVDSRPSPLAWACPKPGVGGVLISDLSWPTDPRLGGRLLASIRLTEPNELGKMQFSGMQLWWLKLDSAATRVVEAGPLVVDDAENRAGRRTNARSPVVASLADGSLGLAYTRQFVDEVDWSVRLIRLEVDADHRPVASIASHSRTIGDGCRPAPLAFSYDGRWLNALIADATAAAPVARFAANTDMQPTVAAATSAR